MPAGLTPTDGSRLLYAEAASLLKPSAAAEHCKLYDNNVVPSRDSILGDFNEASFSGYAAVNITAWSSMLLDTVTKRWEYVPASSIVFTNTGTTPVTIYGAYYLFTTLLIAAERFPSPIVLDTPGQSIVLSPRFQQFPWSAYQGCIGQPELVQTLPIRPTTPLVFNHLGEVLLSGTTVTNIFQTSGAGTKVGLFTNNYVPNDTTLLSDLVEPTGGWYSQQSVTDWAGPGEEVTGNNYLWYGDQAPIDFSIVGTPSPAETIYGWFLTDGTDLLLATRFDTPISFAFENEVLPMRIVLGVIGYGGPSSV